MIKTENEQHDVEDVNSDIPSIKSETKIKKIVRKSRLGVKVTRNPDDSNIVGDDVQEPAHLTKFIKKVPDTLNSKYDCTLCNKFSHKSLSNTRTHLQRKHFPTLFTYHCDQCENTFTNIAGYSKHKYGDTCIDRKPDKKTILLEKRKKKNKHENQTASKKYKCEYCDFKTIKESRVKIHCLNKYDGLGFQSKKCEYWSFNEEYVKRHISNKHIPNKHIPKELTEPNINNISKQENETNINTSAIKEEIKFGTELGVDPGYFLEKKENPPIIDKGFKCEECKFSSCNSLNLKLHSKRAHQNQIEVFCSDCPFVTTNKSYLNIHIKNKHKGVTVRREYRTTSHKDGLPEHSFAPSIQNKPKLIVGEFVLRFDKIFKSKENREFAYFSCNQKTRFKCRASGKASVEKREKVGKKEDKEGEAEKEENKNGDIVDLKIGEKCCIYDVTNFTLISYYDKHTHTETEGASDIRIRRRRGVNHGLRRKRITEEETIRSNESIKVTKNPESCTDENKDIENPSDLKKYVSKDPTDVKYSCTLCSKFSQKSLSGTRNHVESRHFPDMFTYHCDQCDRTFSSIGNCRMHIHRKHTVYNPNAIWHNLPRDLPADSVANKEFLFQTPVLGKKC